MNPYHYRLNLPVEFIPHYLEECEFRYPYPDDLINKELVDWLEDKDVKLTIGEEFLLAPDKTPNHEIHIDGDQRHHFIKMNFVYCETPSLMNWYKIKEGKSLTNVNSAGGTPYLVCLPEDCDLVYSAQVGTPSIVNVMELHDVSTVQSSRYCFSFVMFKINNGNPRPLLWSEAEEIFKDYIISE